MRGFVKRGLVVALASLMLCGSCAAAISVDPDYALEYLYNEKIKVGDMPCYYGYDNGLYFYNCIYEKKYYESKIVDRNSDDEETQKNIDFWEVQKIAWRISCQKCKDLLDQSGLSDESVMVTISYDIGSAGSPVCIPLFIFKDGVLIYDIGDSMQPTE